MNNEIIIRNLDPQEITINEGGTITGITNVYVNGTDVTIGTKAYVIVPTKLSELTNDEGFITNAEETDPTVPSYVKEITMADINNWNDKQDELVSGSNIKTINNNSLLGSGDIEITATEYVAGTGIDITGDTISNTITSYNDLTDLPTPITNTSQLVNDSGFITNRVDDLQNYLTTSVIESILPHSSDSGTGDLYLQNSANYNIHMTLKPSEIEQHTTTGKQLFDKTNIVENKRLDSGGNLYNENGYFTSDFIEVKSNTDYTLQRSTPGGSSSYCLYDENQSFISRTTTQTQTTWSFTTTNETVYIRIADYTADLNIIMLEEGNTPSTYEEYTGGMPSPNPLYPQDIHDTVGENTITVSSKNLFKTDVIENEESRGLTFNSDGNTITVNGTVDNSYYPSLIIFADGSFTTSDWWPTTSTIDPSKGYFTNNTYNYILSLLNSGTASSTFRLLIGRETTLDNEYITVNVTKTKTFAANSEKINFISIGFSPTQSYNLTINMQLERGTTATSYVPYQSQDYPIDLGTWDYLKIGDTADRIYKNVLSDPDYTSNVEIGKWCRRDNIYPVYLAYIGDFTSVVDNGNKYSFYNNNAIDVPRRDVCENPYGKSIYFNNVADGNNNIIESTGLGTVRIDIDKKVGISTLEDLTQWISDNQVVVYFPLKSGYYYGKSAVSEPLDTQLNALSQAMAYEGGTNITQENDDLPFDIVADTLEKISS